MEALKAKSAAKTVIPRSPALKAKILETAKLIATVVGGTLGPGGRPVLIERPEYGVPPIVTKDGVTVFRALGFQDAVQHVLLESARDCAAKTALEAGDGTTTTTILYEALVRLTAGYCERHPGHAPQLVVKALQQALEATFRPEIDRLALRGDLATDEGRRRLRAVARVSANGDDALADAVLQAFDVCGDDGNVTIVDGSARVASYRVEKIDGFPIAMGYEFSCERFATAFVNRPDLQMVQLENPCFILYFGRVNDVQTLLPLMERLNEHWKIGVVKTPNFVLCATGFSESVLAFLSLNWANGGVINIFPLLVPNNSPVANAQRQFLDDLAAVTSGAVYDPVTAPLDQAEFAGIGNLELVNPEAADLPPEEGAGEWRAGGVRLFEAGRHRSSVVGYYDEGEVLARAAVVKAQVEQAASQLDAELTKVRLAALTGGIARLHVLGASNAEVRERRDRADDAICAVRGAVRDGCLPGACWTLLRLASLLDPGDSVHAEILGPALLQPIRVLLDNVGLADEDQQRVVGATAATAATAAGLGMPESARVYDAAAGHMVYALEAGLLDSLPAVRDALTNAISIAAQHGTLGGVIVQPRDGRVDRDDARDAADFERNANVNPADERA